MTVAVVINKIVVAIGEVAGPHSVQRLFPSRKPCSIPPHASQVDERVLSFSAGPGIFLPCSAAGSQGALCVEDEALELPRAGRAEVRQEEGTAYVCHDCAGFVVGDKVLNNSHSCRADGCGVLLREPDFIHCRDGLERMQTEL